MRDEPAPQPAATVTAPRTSVASKSVPTALALVILVLLPLRAVTPFASSFLSLGVIISIALAPVTLPAVMRYRFGTPIVVGYLLVFLTAPMTWVFAGAHEVDAGVALLQLAPLLASLVFLVTILWARQYLSLATVAVALAVGMAAQAALSTGENYDLNPWKFGLAVPATLVVLAVSTRLPRLVTLGFLGVLAVVSGVAGYRSFIAFLLITALFWVLMESRRGTTKHVWRRLLPMLALTYLAYVALLQAALMGWLGQRNRDVTITQLASGGSVFTAGRSETAATIALFLHRPIGLGPGVLPAPEDVAVGTEALFSSGVDVDGTYVKDYLFGETIKLHSVAADLWITFGLAGLVLAAILVAAICNGLFHALKAHPVSPLAIFLGVLALWDMAFSPIGTNLWQVVVAVGLLLPVATAARAPRQKSFRSYGARSRLRVAGTPA